MITVMRRCRVVLLGSGGRLAGRVRRATEGAGACTERGGGRLASPCRCLMDPTRVLLDNVRDHFDEATVADGVVDLGPGDVKIRAWVESVRPGASFTSVSLFFQVWGGPLGEHPVFASASGYASDTDDDVVTAIIAGACPWSCTLRSLLQACDGEDSGVDGGTVRVHGQRFRVLVDGWDRAFSFGRRNALGERGPGETRRLTVLLGGDRALAADPSDRSRHGRERCS